MIYDYLETDLIGTLTLVGDEAGLRHIDFPTARKPLRIDPAWKKDRAFFRAAREQLTAYFNAEFAGLRSAPSARGYAFPTKGVGGVAHDSLWRTGLIQMDRGEDRQSQSRACCRRRQRPQPLPVVIPATGSSAQTAP